MSHVEEVLDLGIQVADGLDAAHFQRLASNQVLERFPLKQLHRDEVPPVGFIDLVDCVDLRVIRAEAALT